MWNTFFLKIGESHWFSRLFFFVGGGGGGGVQGSDDVKVSDRFSSEKISNPEPYVLFVFCNLVISNFSFEGGTLVLISSLSLLSYSTVIG